MKRTYVPPSGNKEAKLGICGEQPGIWEIRARPPKPFVGPAGKGLDECFQLEKIPRSSLYLTNVIKDLDLPLSGYINLDTKNKYTISPEGYQYIQELKEELSSLNLNCIVACGNIALLALTNRVGITKWRGSVIESTLVPGLKVVPTFHPATFIPPKFNFLNKPLICEDLSRAKKECEFREINRKERKLIIHPKFEYAIECINHAYSLGLKGQIISIDLEIINQEIDCFSVGWSPVDAASIALRDNNGDCFTPDQELEIMKALGKIITCDKIEKGGANYIFDMQFLFHKYGLIPEGKNHCTQIAQKISYPDYSAGLAFVTTMYTDIPYYKQDGKEWIKMGAGTWQEWWTYNAMDAIVPTEALPKQFQTLARQQNEEIYDRHRRLQAPLLYMAEHGIKVDVDGMQAYQQTQADELKSLADRLNQVVGYEINYNSPNQLMNYFYSECKINPYRKKNAKGKYEITTDVDALKRIKRRNILGSEAADIMLSIRSLAKRISTYLDIGKVDQDGRYRSSYKPVGTDTGRIASATTIFGSGGNQQNWPHDLLRFFVADDGYIIYSFDLSQIENRIVAYTGGVIPQIEAFEAGIDLHRLTASIIFNKHYDEISSVDGSSDLGDGRQSERYWGKKGNHAINYDVQYKTFALKNEMPEVQAKKVLTSVHNGYPQIRGGYHALIENMLKKNRTVVNLFGRKRIFFGPIIPSPPSVPPSACTNTYRSAYAHFPQSTCADKINEQGILFTFENQHWFKEVELLTQIHDAEVFQLPLSLPWVEHAKILLRIKNSLETPMQWHDIEIATPADLAIGLNMCKEEMKEFKSAKIPSDVTKLAELLKTTYEELKNPTKG